MPGMIEPTVSWPVCGVCPGRSSDARERRTERKFGVVRFWRKIRSSTVSPADEFTAACTFDALLGPSPMRPDETGLSFEGTTLTEGKTI